MNPWKCVLLGVMIRTLSESNGPNSASKFGTLLRDLGLKPDVKTANAQNTQLSRLEKTFLASVVDCLS